MLFAQKYAQAKFLCPWKSALTFNTARRYTAVLGLTILRYVVNIAVFFLTG